MKRFQKDSKISIILPYLTGVVLGVIIGFLLAIAILDTSKGSIDPYKEIRQCMKAKTLLSGLKDGIFLPHIGLISILKLNALLRCCVAKTGQEMNQFTQMCTGIKFHYRGPLHRLVKALWQSMGLGA